MKLIPVCSALCALVMPFAAASPDDIHDACKYHPIKVSKLDTCSTATRFCRQYLSATSFTPTITHTLTRTTTFSSTFTFTTYQETPCVPTAQALAKVAAREPGAATVTAPAKLARAKPADNARCGIIPNANPTSISRACECFLDVKSVTRSTTTSTATVAAGTAYACTDNIYDSNFLLRVTGTSSSYDGQDLVYAGPQIATTTNETGAIVWEFQQLSSSVYYLTGVKNGHGNFFCQGYETACECNPAEYPTFTCTADPTTGDLSCVSTGGNSAQLYIYEGFVYDYQFGGGTSQLTLQAHNPGD